MADRGECKHAGPKNAAGLIWCEKKNRYVTGEERPTCEDWEAK